MITSPLEAAMSLDVRGRYGYTAGCGFARAGYSRCGASKELGGIYQRKKTLQGKKLSRMRYYRPTNPQTTAQQNWRSVFADGKTAYDALDDGQRMVLSKEARHYRMTGYNLFMRRWLQGRRA